MTLIGFAARVVAENASVMPGIGDERAPNLHRVFTDWTFSPTGGSVILLASLLYVVLARRVRICGGRWPLSRSVAWWCAVASLTVAIDSSVAVYSGALFWVHMLQHLLLIMVVPVLLVCAQPIRLLQTLRNQPASPSGQVRLVLRWVTSPVLATVLYAAVLITTHLTGFQQLMQTHMWVHAGETVLYLLSGYLLFGPLIGNEAWPWRLPYLLRFVLLAVTMGVPLAHGQFVGSRRVLRRAERVIRPAMLIRRSRMVAVTAVRCGAVLAAGCDPDGPGQVERRRRQDEPRGVGHEIAGG